MAKKSVPILCEATRTVPATVAIDSDDQNYPIRVCKDVAKRLKALALTPLEFYRLGAIHRRDHWLHPDFYNDVGVALQPAMPVPKQNGDRYPTFQEVRNNMDDLLDYFFSRPEHSEYTLQTLQALAQFDKDRLFQAVERRLGCPARKAIECEVYLIYQHVVPRQLSASLEGKWRGVREDGLGALGAIAQLAAASVPAVGVAQTLTFIRHTVVRLKWPDETRKHAPVYYHLPSDLAYHLKPRFPGGVLVELLLELMDKLPAKQRASMVLHALSHVRDDRVLDWIERNAVPPIGYEWGTAVACNEPSWTRLAEWLDKGRPLSLIALDALKNCRGFDPSDDNMSGVFQDVSPKIHGPVSLNAVREKVIDYLRLDSAPRVKKVADVVLANLESIVDPFTP